MNKNKTLDRVAFYSEDRIKGNKISKEDFVTTDSMLSNRCGTTLSAVFPKGNLVAFSEGDILVANIRPYLKKIWYANKQGGCSPDVLVFKAKPGTVSRFLYYSLFRDDFFIHMMRGSKGSKMPRGDKNQILSFHVPDLGIDEQKKIASVLSSLDAKIELNNRINAELEAIAKTIYYYWFVQFDFPDNNGNPYKSSGGKMVWNDELNREIPDIKGWKVGSLEGWIKEDKGGDWGKENSVGNYVKQVNCIRGADINGLNGSEECNPPERFILDKNSHKILNDADIVIEISGGSPTQSTGRLGFVTNDTFARFDHPLICSNFCKAISLKGKDYLFVFVQLWNMLYDNGAFFGYEGKTSGIKNFLYDTFVNSYYTVYPEKSIVEKYNSIVSPLQTKKQANLLENKKLIELRDWLLPMLMNGQVTVQDAANMPHAMAAEPETEYQTKSHNKKEEDAFVKRKMLGTYIINQSLEDPQFGDVKFEKLLHLAEYHSLKRDFGQKYFQQAAGPYDNSFTIPFFKQVEKSQWFIREKQGRQFSFRKGAKHEKSNKTYSYFSDSELGNINQLIGYFKNSNYEQPEIVSTLYAVWNNRLIRKQQIDDEALVEDFYNWDKQKKKYERERLLRALSWMRKVGIVPDGWGREIIKKGSS